VAPQLPGWRLPREGPEDGGGRMQVVNRTAGECWQRVERPGGIEVGLEGFLGYRVRDEADNDE
jgi:hypothetical protein